MRILCILLIFLFTRVSVAHCQDHAIDSLWNVWSESSNADTMRMSALKEIIIKEKYYAHHLDTTIILAGKIVEVAKASNLLEWESEGYRLMGVSSYFNAQYTSAISYYKRVAEIKHLLNDRQGLGGTYHSIAVSYKLLGDLAMALDYNLKALALRKEVGYHRGVALSLQSIATVYYNQNNLGEALKYGEEGFELSKSLNYDLGTANAAVSIGNVYTDLSNYTEALEYFKRAERLYERLGRPRNVATVLDNIGNVHAKQKDYKLAQDYQQKSLALRIGDNDKKGLALSYINLGVTSFKLGHFNTNISSCHKGLSIAEETKNQRLIYSACDCLYKAYESNGDLENAYKFYRKYVMFKDSIEGVEKVELIEEIEAKYELQEKEALLTKQQLDIERARNNRSTIIISSLIVIGLLSLLFAIIRNRLLRHRREAELSAELEHEESKKLRELDRLKSTFFTNISHEFRTPLTLIMSPLEQMISGTLRGDISKYQKIMYRNGQRLKELINQLLDLSKLESGHFELKLQEGNLTQFSKGIAQSFVSLADRKQIKYVVEGPEKELITYFDKDIIEKILMNLISNAFKFTHEEGDVLVGFKYSESHLEIRVVDSGIGIPREHIGSVFDRFYSSENSSDLQMSSGIGLALTKELIELCDGEITVESEEGKGTKFVVLIPVTQISNQEPEQTQDDNNQKIDKLARHEDKVGVGYEGDRVTQRSMQKNEIDFPTILIVEDNEDVRRYLKDQLQLSYNIEIAENGKEGVQKAVTLQPELIVSDVMMPEMDGNKMCSEIKTNPITSHIPVILLTARADQGDRIQGLETGADAYLTKPFDHEELDIRIKNLINQRKQLREKFRSDFRFSPSELTVTSVDADFLQKVKILVEQNLEDETFSVVELSKELSMSRSNLYRKLKALTNQSPNQVIREMRLIRAKELLEKGAGNSAEIAYMVGFNSATYFTKCFGDFFGVSPSKINE